MFYARVMIGNSKTVMPPMPLMPPIIEGNQRYDSVNGNMDGSEIFMIYTNKKAYPEYLVSYT